MATGFAQEKNLERQIEKQMGCMAGFLQIFDRHHILTGKRLYSAKRLPPLPAVDTTSESDKSGPASPAVSANLGKNKQSEKKTETQLRSPPPPQPKSPLPLPVFEVKDGARSSWKFRKEAPRLSLDSRATTDAKGGLHPKEMRTAAAMFSGPNKCDSRPTDTSEGGQHNRSPSVIARLMGLEQFPNSPVSEEEKQPELRRSASESRVSKDIFQSRFTMDGSGGNNYSKQQTQSHSNNLNSRMKDNTSMDAHYADPRKHSMSSTTTAEQPKAWGAAAPPHRKSYFDSCDVFPEPKQSVSICGEIEKRLKRREIDEPSKDLETLKQILEALQLKGLIHSKQMPPANNQVRHRNFVYDESPIVLMKPARSSPSTPISRRVGNDQWPSNIKKQIRGVCRNYNLAGETSPSVSPRRERNVRSPTRSGRSSSPTTTRSSENNPSPRRPNSVINPKQLSIDTQRTNRSPKANARKIVYDPTTSNRSPRSNKSAPEIQHKEKNAAAVVADDESSSISGSSITTSTTDTEKSKAEEYKDGRHLLERCDKLLHSIAEMAAADMQPSPVSVLDSSFYKDESLTPSPVTTKRCIDFKDQLGEHEEVWSPVISPIRSKKCVEISDDSDFLYISDILRAFHYLPEESDIFPLLEKQQYLKGNDTSKASTLQRKLIFDTINEILDAKRRLPPWKASATPSLERVWLEFQKIRERDFADDLFEMICGIMKKDMASDAINGWDDCPIELSEAVLDIERLIFKDLIGEAIWDLGALAASRGTFSSMMMTRRKLVY